MNYQLTMLVQYIISYYLLSGRKGRLQIHFIVLLKHKITITFMTTSSMASQQEILNEVQSSTPSVTIKPDKQIQEEICIEDGVVDKKDNFHGILSSGPYIIIC